MLTAILDYFFPPKYDSTRAIPLHRRGDEIDRLNERVAWLEMEARRGQDPIDPDLVLRRPGTIDDDA